jgi:hypothetical protein
MTRGGARRLIGATLDLTGFHPDRCKAVGFDGRQETLESLSFDLPRRVVRDVHCSIAVGASRRRH